MLSGYRRIRLVITECSPTGGQRIAIEVLPARRYGSHWRRVASRHTFTDTGTEPKGEFERCDDIQYRTDADGYLDDDGSDDGAALRSLLGGCQTTAWYRHGWAHRDGDRPARVSRKPPPAAVVVTAYRQNGALHRDAYDQPAEVVVDADSGNVLERRWWRHGERHRDADDRPQRIAVMPHAVALEWARDGFLHRSSAQPASMHWNEFFGWTATRYRYGVASDEGCFHVPSA